LFTGKYDNNSCFLEIHPGAGGTESCDWASMLLRMYQMFCDKNGYTYEELDLQKGDEAGIKSATLKITGPHAYGYFKSEQGVHRLVRISPFDSNSRRHTSFAAVSLVPEIKQSSEVIIKPEDLRIDVYRSSGKGGQGVNTTDSAVRITHYPTGIVVTCQNERSQIQNKETALKVLTSKLAALIEKTNEKDLDKLKSHVNIDFGSQIRNYILEPYQLVKDTRTNYQTANATAVLNGDIIEFMKEYLRIKR
jgi:peptide chain release factor 2